EASAGSLEVAMATPILSSDAVSSPPARWICASRKGGGTRASRSMTYVTGETESAETEDRLGPPGRNGSSRPQDSAARVTNRTVATRTDVLTRPPFKGEVVGGRRGAQRSTPPLPTARRSTPSR